MRVIFSHGHLSSPESRKIRELAPLAEARGCSVEAIDYRDLRDDPVGRIERLSARLAELEQPPLLVGSSLGGLVSVAAAERREVAGLFLLAPALFLEDRIPGGVVRSSYQPRSSLISVVHGWQDDVIPWRHSLRFAEQQAGNLHLFDADHRLESVLPAIARLFDGFLAQATAGRTEGNSV